MNGRVEIRKVEPGGQPDNRDIRLAGYASVFGNAYPIGSGQVETIAPGAFKRTLANQPEVTLLVEHRGLPLASTTGGAVPTLRLAEDAHGLAVDADLNARDPRVQELLAVTEHTGGTDMSFAFRTNPAGESWNNDFTVRTIKECSIHRGDVSIVTRGANPQTGMDIIARNADLAERKAAALEMRGRVIGPAAFTSNAEVLAPRGRSQIAVPRMPSVTRRSHLELARAYAVKGEFVSGANRRSPRMQQPVGSSRRGHLEIARATRVWRNS
jgi:HK97 family phage prohead protease